MLECINTIANVLLAIAALLTVIGGFIALSKSLSEYRLQQTAKRAELYFGLRDDYRKTEHFKKIAPLLEDDKDDLKDLAYTEKLDFLGHYEEVALLNNSGLLNDDVAYYMFGYFAIQCWKSKNFWNNIERDTIYWAAYKDFAERMIQIEKKFKYNPSRFKL